jgi:multiple antibiotic resistance protein
VLSVFIVAFPAVLFIVDPVGVIPLFVAMTANDSVEKCKSMARRATLTAFLLLTFFALFGALIFKVFGVTLAAFKVAGGLLLMLTALDMLKAQAASTRTSKAETDESATRDDIAIVPLAMPLLAGPGAIATVMVLMGEQGGGIDVSVAVIASIFLTMLLTYALLRQAQLVKRFLGQTGIAVLERIFGLILAAIAVQFVFEGGRALMSGVGT